MNEAPGSGQADSRSHPAGRDEVVRGTIDAAIELFSQRNPGQVSVREIAARAGVSHALVHRYMGSKQDIFCATLTAARDAAAEYWLHNHGMAETVGTFQSDLPPGRYVRIVVRAALDGITISPEDMKLPHADMMLEFLKTTQFPSTDAERPFDVRLLFSAVTAMAAGMAVAEDFFLAQSGLQDADPEYVYDELNRLIRLILTFADTSASLAEEPSAG